MAKMKLIQPKLAALVKETHSYECPEIVALDPREPLGVSALALVRRGRRLSVQGLNRAILLEGQGF